MNAQHDSAAANDPTMDLKQAAAFMHLGLEAMKALVETGEVPALSLNQKHTILLRDDLIAYVRATGAAQAEKRRKLRAGRQAAPRVAPAKRRGANAAKPDLDRYEITTGAQQG